MREAHSELVHQGKCRCQVQPEPENQSLQCVVTLFLKSKASILHCSPRHSQVGHRKANWDVLPMHKELGQAQIKARSIAVASPWHAECHKPLSNAQRCHQSFCATFSCHFSLETCRRTLSQPAGPPVWAMQCMGDHRRVSLLIRCLRESLSSWYQEQ